MAGQTRHADPPPARGCWRLPGYTLYDCHWDRAYRFTFSEEALLGLFSKTGTPTLHVQAMHLALVHFPDISLATRVRRRSNAMGRGEHGMGKGEYGTGLAREVAGAHFLTQSPTTTPANLNPDSPPTPTLTSSLTSSKPNFMKRCHFRAPIQIIRYVCEHNPVYANAEVFKEFLTGGGGARKLPAAWSS